MSFELEIKIKIPCEDLERLRDILTKLSILSEKKNERDIYYQHPCRDFRVTDEALRLRFVNGEIESLTYKGPRIGTSQVKERLEIILHIKSGDVEQLLLSLGFKPAIEVRKRREYYKLRDNVTATIDIVEDLGCFVEVEGPSESTILDFIENIGVKGEIIGKTYAELVAERKGVSP